MKQCPLDGTPLIVTGAAEGAVSASAPTVVTPKDPDELVDEVLSPGTPVGEYEVTGQIGEGGMGTVYAGIHPVIGKKVAIKVLSAGLSRDHSVTQRFIQEARAVNQIGHHNIVDIFSFGRLPDGRQYCVMEYLPGRSLKDRLDEEPPLSFEEAFSILFQVLDALSAVHGESIVHRDLKPDNIFLVESKNRRIVKLLDFGIAKLLSSGDVGNTRTGVPMGTPLYMSPEQCLGKGVDARTDIYSLGVIMFEMFCGCVPFSGPSYIETVNSHLTLPPPSPRLYAEIPTELEGLILACLDKEQAARPQTVADVREQLLAAAHLLGTEISRHTSGVHVVVPPATTPIRRPTAPPVVQLSRPATVPPPHRTLVPARRVPAALYLLTAMVGVIALLAAVAALKPGRRAHGHEAALAPQADEGLVALQVLSTPAGAAVVINGKRQALLTPSIFRIPRAAELLVRLETEGYRPFVQKVTLLPGESEKALKVTLEPERPPSGQLHVRTNAPSASFHLDGKSVGDGRGALDLDEVEPGVHTLSVLAPGFRPREEPVEVKAATVASIEWQLSPLARRPHRPARAAPTSKAADLNDIAGWPPK